MKTRKMMMMIDEKLLAGLAAAMILAGTTSPPSLAAQQPAPMMTARAPGPEYSRAVGGEALVGENWRDLWVRPVALPVLDLASFGGGLEPEKQGGGNQSITLHFKDARGRKWVFRSVDKFPDRMLPRDLQHTVMQQLVRDQVSTLHPGGYLVVPRLLDALAILHVTPTIYLMPDDPRLGKYRATFANVVGEFEEKPEEGPDHTPGFAGSTKVASSAGMFEDLAESADYRVADQEYLRARVVDILINDTDRGTDNWSWARFGTKGDYIYRPLPRDRDWAFVNGRGLLGPLIAPVFPKRASFGPDIPRIEAFTYSSHLLDRRLLSRLTRADFRTAVADVQSRLTDAVLASAVHDLPAAMQPGHADQLAADLRTRRDALLPTVMAWYDWLATEPDIHATNEADRADIEFLPHDRLQVRLTRATGGAPYFERIFDARETNEVRVYLHGGNDRAVVQGHANDIGVRVIGAGGNDTFEDRSGSAHFYDQDGRNRYVRGSGTTVTTKPWYEPVPTEGLRFGREWAPDWGRDTGLKPHLELHDGSGLVLGPAYGVQQRGFRRLPEAWNLETSLLYATGSGGLGMQASFAQRFENSRWGINALARATQFESMRFFGFGNESPELPGKQSLVMQDQVRVFAGLTLRLEPQPGERPRPAAAEAGTGAGAEGAADPNDTPFMSDRKRGLEGQLTIGPIAQWTRPRPPDRNPLDNTSLGLEDGYSMLGARAELEVHRTDRAAVPRRGFSLRGEGNAFPALWDVSSAFGNVALTGVAYLPVLGATHLALRAGGERVFGDFPVFESAFIGGRQSLRGYLFDRFAGDASAFGSAELRVPLDTVRIVLNGELGVFGLADAGRVWLDGDSPGGWHNAAGGGVWFSTMGRAVSLTYARGNRNRFYLAFGLPY